jgi:nitronate monooxygenase
MLNELSSSSAPSFPRIIQGGMGAGVSNWRLARAVASEGEMGVISGTALDTVLIRRLQDGDPGGHMRRGLAAFPFSGMAQAVLDEWFIEGGKPADAAYRLKPLPSVEMSRQEEELLIVANFVEVYLAKEGHNGLVGINLLEKIQLPTLPSLFGAMLAEVDVVIMGGGIPLGIPGALDAMSEFKPVELKLNLVSGSKTHEHKLSFHPGTHVPASMERLKRPAFFPVIASEVLAKTLLKKGSGRIDGFVVEHYSAGGHNAPPRRDDAYGEKDFCDPAKIARLGLPFWLAGGCASPTQLKEAQALGAHGVQVGTAFACTEESGILPGIKAELIEKYRKGELEVLTDFQASPTAYPFKRVEVEANDKLEARRPCDLGYLRHIYEKEDGSLGYRCPATMRKAFVKKGGDAEECDGKRCLCNGLLATIGLGQQLKGGQEVQPLVTVGDDWTFMEAMLGEDRESYTASDLIAYLRS